MRCFAEQRQHWANTSPAEEWKKVGCLYRLHRANLLTLDSLWHAAQPCSVVAHHEYSLRRQRSTAGGPVVRQRKRQDRSWTTRGPL
jgi:hypothetical protein